MIYEFIQSSDFQHLLVTSESVSNLFHIFISVKKVKFPFGRFDYYFIILSLFDEQF